MSGSSLEVWFNIYRCVIVSRASWTIAPETILLSQRILSLRTAHQLEIRSIAIEYFVIFVYAARCTHCQCKPLEAIPNVRITGMIEQTNSWKDGREHTRARHEAWQLPFDDFSVRQQQTFATLSRWHKFHFRYCVTVGNLWMRTVNKLTINLWSMKCDALPIVPCDALEDHRPTAPSHCATWYCRIRRSARKRTFAPLDGWSASPQSVNINPYFRHTEYLEK